MVDLLSRRRFLSLAAAAPAGFQLAFAQGAGKSPRCFLNPARLAQAKVWMKEPLSVSWSELVGVCEKTVARGIVRYDAPGLQHDKDRLWQRNVGNDLPCLAMAYLMDGRKAYRDFAFAQALEATTYPIWGAAPKEGVDLPAGHLLMGIGLLVDWLGAEMDERTRNQLVSALKTRGRQMAVGADTAYWHETLLQNHLWVNMTGLLVAGLALEPYDAQFSRVFVTIAKTHVQPCFAVLAPDGSDQEGPGYWEYGAEYLLKYQQLVTELLGVTVDSPWLRHTAEYRIAMTVPLASAGPQQAIFNVADSLRTGYYGPNYLLRRLASLNRDSAAQEMAQKLEDARAIIPVSPWLNFIWYDPTVPASGLEALPTLQHFEDLDLIVARSDRSGHESAVVMRCGPPLGKMVQAEHAKRDLGLAHTHPEVNAICLFGAGQYLLRNSGYSGIKDPRQQNTLMVNDLGQVGSGGQWTRWPSFPIADPQPTMAAVTPGPGHDYWVGVGAAAYPEKAGLRRFDRHVLFLKPDVLVVIDDLAATDAADFVLYWHPGAALQGDGVNRYVAKVSGTSLRMDFVLPEEARVTTGVRTFPTHEEGSGTMDEITVAMKAKSVQCATVMSWAKSSTPSEVTVTRGDGVWSVVTGTQRYSVDVKARRVTVT